MNKSIKISSVVILSLIISISFTNTSSSAQNNTQSAIGITQRVSVASDGMQGNKGSYGNAISADGRYVAFVSDASNLVPGDTNNYCAMDFDNIYDDNCPDVFVHDRLTGQTTRVSVASDGTQGDYRSGNNSPSISADGRYVAFDSYASTLVPVDANGHYSDVFVHDRQTGVTSLVSVSSTGEQGNYESYEPAISADGRYVAFASNAQNLVIGDQNGFRDVFVHDRQTGETSIVSISSEGEQGGVDSGGLIAISGNGRYVSFFSQAANLVGEPYIYYPTQYLHDRQTGETTLVALAPDGSRENGHSIDGSLSFDGRYIAFISSSTNLVPGDTNDYYDDVFVRDQVTGETVVASVNSAGSKVLGGYYGVSISPDGNFVSFSSDASDFVPDDTNGNMDVFLHNMQTSETSLISVANDGTQADWHSWYTSISANGRIVAFDSWASNLVPGDSNNYCYYPPSEDVNCPDVFVRDTEAVGIHTISGRVTDSSGLPVAGATVSASSWYSAVTDAAGNYSIGEVYTGTYRLIPELGTNLFTPLSRTVTLPPNAENQDFTLEIPIADLTFRPKPDGYYFANGFAPGAGNFSLQDMRRMFGDESVCAPFALSCKYNWQSWLWRSYALQTIVAGQSDGMAVSALRFFKGSDAHPGFEDTYMLDLVNEVEVNWNSGSFSTTLQNDIAFFSMEQLLEPVRQEKHQSRQDTPAQVLDDVISALSDGASDPITLFIRPAPGQAGYTLVPYAVTEHGDGIHWIWVYDSEHPYDEFKPLEAARYIIIDTVNDTWNYDIGWATWSGNAASHTLGIIPLSQYAQQPDCPWCDTSTSKAEVWHNGGGHLLITDSQGRHLGYVGDDCISEIPEAYCGFIDTTTMSVIQPIYTLPLTETYSILLDGYDLVDPMISSVAQFGPGYAVQVGNILVATDTADQLRISNDGAQAGYHATLDQELNLTLGFDRSSANYATAILGADVAAGEGITVTHDTAAGTLILDGSAASGGEYTLSIRMINANGTVRFVHPAIPLLATDTHIIHFADWNGSGIILLEIDHGSDGTVDETIQLENQLVSYFLPLVTTHE